MTFFKKIFRLAAVGVILLFASGVSAVEIVDTVTPEAGKDVGVEYIRVWETILAATNVSTTTPTVVLLNDDGRTYQGQGFVIYNTSNTEVEFALGGETLTTCSGVSPVTQIQSNETYTVRVADLSKVRINQLIEIYDASAGNAVLLRGRVVGKDDANSLLWVSYESGSTPTNAAASDPVGGPNRYTFTAGTGHVVQADSESKPIRPIHPYSILHIKGLSSGNQSVRVIQSN